jgi:hypothetical protein
MFIHEIIEKANAVEIDTGWANKSIVKENRKLSARIAQGREVLEPMFKRNYWTRLWVLQEFVCAKVLIVFCGRFHLECLVSWDLYLMMKLLRRDRGLEIFGPADDIVKMRFKNSAEYDDSTRKVSKSVLRSHTLGGRFKCVSCKIWKDSREDFFEHIIRHHPKVTDENRRRSLKKQIENSSNLNVVTIM